MPSASHWQYSNGGFGKPLRSNKRPIDELLGGDNTGESEPEVDDETPKPEVDGVGSSGAQRSIRSFVTPVGGA